MARCDPIAAGAGAEPLGGRVPEVPGGGLEVSLERGRALDVEVDPQQRAEVACDPFVAARGVPEPVVDVQRVDVLRPDRPGQAGGGAGRVGPARDENDPGGDRLDQATSAHRLDQALQGLVSGLTHTHVAILRTRSAARGGYSPRAPSVPLARATKSSIGWGKPFSSTLADRVELEIAGVADRVDDRGRDHHLAAQRAGDHPVRQVHLAPEVVAVAVDGAADSGPQPAAAAAR